MQVDRQIGAEMTAMVLQFSLPPNMFSVCMNDCIEDLTADTRAIDISSPGYNKAVRTLVLEGEAPPEHYQSVLQTLVYTNTVPTLCPEDFVLTVSDGVHSTTKFIPVVKSNSRRRKSATSNKHLYILRHLNSKTVDDTLIKTQKEEKSKEEVKHVLLLIPMLVVFAIVMTSLVIFSVWKKQHKKEDPCNSP